MTFLKASQPHLKVLGYLAIFAFGPQKVLAIAYYKLLSVRTVYSKKPMNWAFYALSTSLLSSSVHKIHFFIAYRLALI